MLAPKPAILVPSSVSATTSPAFDQGDNEPINLLFPSISHIQDCRVPELFSAHPPNILPFPLTACAFVLFPFNWPRPTILLIPVSYTHLRAHET